MTVEKKSNIAKICVLCTLGSLLVFVIFDQIFYFCEFLEEDDQCIKRIFCTSNVLIQNVSATDSECRQETSCINLLFLEVNNILSINLFLAILIIIIGYILSTVLMIPGSLLSLGAAAAFNSALGFLNGFIVGSVVVWIGATIGGILAFLNGRYLLTDYAYSLKKKYSVVNALDKAIEINDVKVVFLLRLTPIVPFNVTNYILGATSCTLNAYIIATSIGIIPGTAAFVLIGAFLSETLIGIPSTDTGNDFEITNFTEEDCFSEEADTIQLAIFFIGVVLAVFSTTIISNYAYKEWIQLQSTIQTSESHEL